MRTNSYCNSCKTKHPLTDEFWYLSSKNQWLCKIARRRAGIKNYKKHKNNWLERQAKWASAHPDIVKKHNLTYRKTHKHKYTPSNFVKNKIKYYARRMAALFFGPERYTNKKCEQCDRPATEMHHTNYSKPLNVNWLCKNCHKKLHRKYKEMYTK